MIDTLNKPSDALRLKADLERRGRIRYILNTETHSDHWTGNSFYDVPAVAHEGVRARIRRANLTDHAAWVSAMGPEEPPSWRVIARNAPIITFTSGMMLHVGDHTFRMV